MFFINPKISDSAFMSQRPLRTLPLKFLLLYTITFKIKV